MGNRSHVYERVVQLCVRIHIKLNATVRFIPTLRNVVGKRVREWFSLLQGSVAISSDYDLFGSLKENSMVLTS